MSLARKAFSGIVWTAVERFGLQLVQFAVIVILARLLSPEDFGLVAMLTVIFAISGTLVNGGFTAALIRQPEITERDKATAFWLNVSAAIVLYAVIWLSAPLVSSFFEEPKLIPVTRFMALNLLFLALSLVQQAELTHRLAFKRLGLLSISASIVTGTIAVLVAYRGAGVWALAVHYVVIAASNSLFLWIAEPWLPKHWVSRESFDRLFGFGSKLALSGLINEVYKNVYKVVIGRVYTAAILGFYTQAQNFQRTASDSIVGVLQKVTYPILARASDEPERLKRGYRTIIQVTSYVIFPAMVGLALTAEPLILSLVGNKWRQTVPFLQILCISGALYHLHSVNLNVLKVVGRSDLFLRIEIIKKINTTIAIFIGVQYGIWGLLIGQVVSSYVALYINMYYTKSFIDYSIPEQLKDVAGVLWLSAPMAGIVWIVGEIGPSQPIARLVAMVSSGIASYLLTTYLVRAEPFQIMARLIVPKLVIARPK